MTLLLLLILAAILIAITAATGTTLGPDRERCSFCREPKDRHARTCAIRRKG